MSLRLESMVPRREKGPAGYTYLLLLPAGLAAVERRLVKAAGQPGLVMAVAARLVGEGRGAAEVECEVLAARAEGGDLGGIGAVSGGGSSDEVTLVRIEVEAGQVAGIQPLANGYWPATRAGST